MANLVPTHVKLGSGSIINNIVAGETLTTGQFYYLSSADNKAYACNNATQDDAYVSGVVVTGGAMDEYIVVTTGGEPIDLGVTVVAGELYVVSAVNGQVMPYGDLAATQWMTWACYGDANGNAVLFHKPMGEQKV